jgi:hypothetical protein
LLALVEQSDAEPASPAPESDEITQEAHGPWRTLPDRLRERADALDVTTPLPPSMSRPSAITVRALRVLLGLASPRSCP